MVSGADGESINDGSVGGSDATAAAVGDGAGLLRSSIEISSSSVCLSSFDARLNSCRLLPSDRPSSGSLRGPNTISATVKMMMSSVMPIEPNMMWCLQETAVHQVYRSVPEMACIH